MSKVKLYQCLPRSITRRAFQLRMAGGLATGFLGRRTAQAQSGTPFTVALVPDPQYLASDASCSGSKAYNALIQWGITNRNLPVNGVPLNIKGFLQVGDCVNTSSDTTFSAAQINQRECLRAGGSGPHVRRARLRKSRLPECRQH